jgi:mono/diheme cytochrome c family protein
MKIRTIILTAIALIAALAAATAAASRVAPPEVSAGQRIAQRFCGECHATGPEDVSRQPDAPPFRSLYLTFGIDSLPTRLEGGMLVGHPRMPLIQLDPDEVVLLTAYLKSFIPKQRTARIAVDCGEPCAS